MDLLRESGKKMSSREIAKKLRISVSSTDMSLSILRENGDVLYEMGEVIIKAPTKLYYLK